MRGEISFVDELISGIDRSLKTLTGTNVAGRSNPGDASGESQMSEQERKHVAGLMRINHAGEMCAQALYEGQALMAKSSVAKEAFLHAAGEERDHLSWCRQRLNQLDASPSVFDPLFYGASFVLGAGAGLLGDRISLGFVEATEDQVAEHLAEHLKKLPKQDTKTRLILEEMMADEARHGAEALAQGGQIFPAPIKNAMRLVSKVMTKSTYRI
jgi:ubiquinone biosynthesis monooxygenase Coq7